MKPIIDLTPPFMETNFAVSLTVITPPDGIVSQLSQQSPVEPKYDGVKVADLRQMHDIIKHDKIDGVAIASQRLSESVSNYRKTELHKEFTKRITAPRKVNKN